MRKFQCLLMCLFFALQAAAAEPAPGEIWAEPGTGMRFAWIPGGCFTMGSVDGYAYERPAHKVCVKGFYLGVYPVTQAQYQKVVGKNPSANVGADLPVESLNWNDAMKMAHLLAQASGEKLRLPSEAE